MPKKATILYTSSDAPRTLDAGGGNGGGNGAQPTTGDLHVYHCRASGRAAFITDADVDALPRRRADGAAILDTTRYTWRPFGEAKQGAAAPPPPTTAAKLVRRADGSVERQFRLCVGPLPFAYRSPDPSGELVYVLPDAVVCFAREGAAAQRAVVGGGIAAAAGEAAAAGKGGGRGGAAGGDPSAPLVPPCIRAGGAAGGWVEADLAVAERQAFAAVRRVTAKAVLVDLAGGGGGGGVGGGGGGGAGAAASAAANTSASAAAVGGGAGVVAGAMGAAAEQELVALLARTLGVRPTALTLLGVSGGAGGGGGGGGGGEGPGPSSGAWRNKPWRPARRCVSVAVDGLTARQVYMRLREGGPPSAGAGGGRGGGGGGGRGAGGGGARGGRGGGGGGGGGGKKRPWFSGL
jgi:hypothetical protein